MIIKCNMGEPGFDAEPEKVLVWDEVCIILLYYADVHFLAYINVWLLYKI